MCSAWWWCCGADAEAAMTSKNSGVSASTTMSSLGKACLELSKSIKGFRFSRQSPPQDSKDAASSCGQLAGASASASSVTTSARPLTAEDGTMCDDVTSGVSDAAAAAMGAGSGGSSVTSTISRVIRSATNRVRAFPASPSQSPQHHQHHGQQQQQQLQACNAINGHSPPSHVALCTPPPLPSSSRPGRTRCLQLAPANTDVWNDEQFLLRFFRYFSTVELCVLAQVLSHSLTFIPSDHTQHGPQNTGAASS